MSYDELHRAEWLARYGADYGTDADREQGYRDHQTELAVIRAIFAEASA